MRIPVDIVTGADPPSYTMEILTRLPSEIHARLIRGRGYTTTTTGKAYRLVHHPLAVRRSRRKGGILHVDTQLLAYVLALPVGPRTVVTCHDLAPFHAEYDDPSYVSRRHPLDRLYLRLLRSGLHRARCVVTVSEFVKAELASFGRRRDVYVVSQGVDSDRFRPRGREECRAVLEKYGVRTHDPIVLYVGSEHPRKNLPGLLRSFARIRRPSTVLVKVGAPRHPQREELLRLTQTLGLNHRVAFVDRVEGQDLPFLYGAASAVVLPSFYEGFGLPPLEAMACGVAVAASNLPSVAEVCGDAVAYFDPHDETAIAAAIESLLSDGGLAEEIRARGRSRAQEFPWSRTVRGMVAVYDRTAEPLDSHR